MLKVQKKYSFFLLFVVFFFLFSFTKVQATATDNSSMINCQDQKSCDVQGNNSYLISKESSYTSMNIANEESFVEDKKDTFYRKELSIILPLVFLLIGYLIWKTFGKDNLTVEVNEFYPPSGINSLEAAFLYKGKVNDKDVASLIFYLATKGYIKITEITERGYNVYSEFTSFKLTKLKDYDGNNENEQLFFDALFKSDPSVLVKNSMQSNVEEKTSVTAKTLYKTFYKTTKKILRKINNRENKEKIFEKTSLNKRIFLLLMIVATFCLITIPPFLNYGKLDYLIVSLLLPGISFSIMFYMMCAPSQTIYSNGLTANSSFISMMHGILIGALLGGLPWFMFALPAMAYDRFYLIAYFIGLLCVFGLVACLRYLPKRTLYGKEMLNRLKGFQNFLETAEKNKLESLLLENPNYFYDMLPYACVFGLSYRWIEKFESISVMPPTWYEGEKEFKVVSFGLYINSVLPVIYRTMNGVYPGNRKD